MYKLPQLQHEFEVYQSLIGDGIPSVQWFETECDYNALILTQLGRCPLKIFQLLPPQVQLEDSPHFGRPDGMLYLLQFVTAHSVNSAIS